MDPFETERLLLRPLAPSDLDDLFALYRQPELMQYITGKPRSYEMTRERLRAHLTDHIHYGFGYCAAILKADGRMIGRCGLEPVERPGGVQGNIGWMFARAYWGRGLATESAVAMLPYGFDRLGLQRIYATADHRNVASIRVMQKIGMRFVRSNARGVEYEVCRP
jgi:ribosomal-protein-alanine N-acetyltransferase